MIAMCPNLECAQKYKVPPSMKGSAARCKKCNTVFKIEEYTDQAKDLKIDIEEDQPEETQTPAKKKRKSSKEKMLESIDRIIEEVERVVPLLMDSFERRENESDTRQLIDSMLQNILGYAISDMKTEMKIKGMRADYVLSVQGKPAIIIEAKRIGMTLREQQISQASGYGAHSGIKWVVLTNALVWQLYRLSFGEKIKSELVFTIDLLDGLDNEEAEYFYLISKEGMSKKNLLEKLWVKIRTLSSENLQNVILGDEVLKKIRIELNKQGGYKVVDEELRQVIEEKLFQL